MTAARITDREARDHLRTAWEEIASDRPATLGALQAVQGVCRRESSYGAGWAETPLEGSWNMAALQAFGWGGRVVAWRDKHADGSGYVAYFRAYPSAYEGFKDALAWFVRRPRTLDAADEGDLDAFATEMRRLRFYESRGATVDEQIKRYEGPLFGCVQAIATALGEPLCLREGGPCLFP